MFNNFERDDNGYSRVWGLRYLFKYSLLNTKSNIYIYIYIDTHTPSNKHINILNNYKYYILYMIEKLYFEMILDLPWQYAYLRYPISSG
jgi:hypothetical protein